VAVGAVWLYTYVFRGTPLYVQLLLCYTGLYSLQIVRGTPLLDAFFRTGCCTLLAFALNTCAYTRRSSPARSGDVARRGARGYGMSAFTMYRRVILPSALRRALPLYSNEVILMLHATTVAFTATVPDILKIARDVNSATYMSFHAFGIAALLYLVISFTLVWLFRQAERRWLAYLRPQGK
jgi:histidine transport system permease protein